MADELHKILDHWARHAFLDDEPAASFSDDLNGCFVGPEEPSPAIQCLLGRLFARLEQSRLLTLLRKGTWAAQRINAYLAHVLRGRLDRQASGMLFAGVPVLITRNDPARQLFNGDVGLTVRGAEGERVVFRRQHQFVSLPVESLPANELGFAPTVHKSQGSEYSEVLVVLPPEAGRRLLSKELIYTAVTRAKQSAILCGTCRRSLCDWSEN